MLTPLTPAESGDIALMAIAIKQVTPEQRHCGIVYRSDADELKLLHLAWHHDLRHEPAFGTKGYRWGPVTLDSDELLPLSVIASRIGIRNDAVPYGFRPGSLTFDPESGELQGEEFGRGFTCATLVLEVFSKHGVRILEDESWPPNANEAWQLQIIENLKAHAAHEHIEALLEDVGCCRVTPEEVVAGAALYDWPISFQDCTAMAAEILAELVADPGAG